MANLVSDKPLDKHLKIIKSGEEVTSLELATEGNGAKIKGDLEITGRITNTVGLFRLEGDKVVVDVGYLYFINLGNRVHFSEDTSQDLYNMFFVSDYNTTLNVTNAKTKGIVTEVKGGTITEADTLNNYNSALNVTTTLNDSSDSGSCVYKMIEGVATNTDITGWDELYLLHLTGASTFYVDNAGHVALSATKKLLFDGGTHTYIAETSDDVLDFTVGALNILKLDEGNDKVEVLGADLEIDAAKKLYLDGGTDTYIHESLADYIEIVVGGDVIMALREAGTSGNTVDFGLSGAGFTQHEPTYDASDTGVNFSREGNKGFLTFGAGNITDLNLYFPNVSCNCQLVIKQDGTGSRTVTNWKTFDQAQGNESTVKWRGVLHLHYQQGQMQLI